MSLKSLFTLSFLIASMSMFSQSNLNSPFSMFGLGNENPDFNGQNFAMGSLGAAMNDPFRVNYNNPASLSSLKNTTAEFSLSGVYNSYKDNSGSSSNFNGHLGGFVMGFPAGKNLGLSMGLKPSFTNGYNVTQADGINNLDSLRNEGFGGINDAFLSIGYSFKGFSLGVSSAYQFGNLTQVKSFIYNDEAFQDSKVEDKLRFSDVLFNYGFQYESPEIKSWKFVLGANYLPSQSISVAQNRTAYNYTTYLGRDIPLDTVFTSNTAADENSSSSYSELAFGLTLKNKHWIIGAEYEQTDYTDFNVYSIGNNLSNGEQYKAGFQYAPLESDERRDKNIHGLGKRLVYRGGVRYKKSPLFINNNQIQEFGISFGVDIPVYSKYSPVNSYVNFGLELGKIGNVNTNNIEESFIKFNLTYTFNDAWFIPEKIN